MLETVRDTYPTSRFVSAIQRCRERQQELTPNCRKSDVSGLASPRPAVIILKAMRLSIKADAGAMPLSTSGCVGRAQGRPSRGCIAGIVAEGWGLGCWDLPAHARLRARASGSRSGATGLPSGSGTCPTAAAGLSRPSGHAGDILGSTPPSRPSPSLLGAPTPGYQPACFCAQGTDGPSAQGN